MNVNGYQLREAIKQWELKRDAHARQFDGSLKSFPGEQKETPEQIITATLKCDNAIALLQAAQAYYNNQITVTFNGSRITLTQAVKMLGGHARAEKMWRKVATPDKDRYGYNNDSERDPTKIYATPTISPELAVTKATEMAKLTGELRQIIATGNAKESEVPYDIRDLIH